MVFESWVERHHIMEFVTGPVPWHFWHPGPWPAGAAGSATGESTPAPSGCEEVRSRLTAAWLSPRDA